MEVSPQRQNSGRVATTQFFQTQMRLQSYRDNLTIKDKVRSIYLSSQEAIDYDDALLSMFEKVFHQRLGIEDTIKRTGRYLRQKEKHLFVRSPDVVRVNKKQFDACRSRYS